MGQLKPLFDLSAITKLFNNEVPGRLILTPNRRLAAQLRAAVNEQQSILGANAWQLPKIYPIEQWIDDCWRELLLLCDEQALTLKPLSSTQELLLWEQIIRQDQDHSLLKPYPTAKSAQTAYRILLLWQTPIAAAFNEHPDCARFAHWARLFKQRCQQDCLIDTGSIAAMISQAFADKKLPAHTEILTLGFQQMPPLYASLLANTGARLIEGQRENRASTTTSVACENAEQELQVAASWIKQQLQQNPIQRIALVVPDLKQRRAQVERIFSAEFEPQYILPQTPRYQTPYNISAGIALNKTPIVHTALTLLQLNRGAINTRDWLMLMHSPFLFDQASVQPSICQAELLIRQRGFPQLSTSQLRQILLTITEPDGAIESWLDALETIIQSLGSRRKNKALLNHWLDFISSQLTLFQWPGQRQLDSIEYQQVKRWQSALSELLTISDICGEIGLEQALSLLHRFIGNIEFQAESAPSPIQILGMLEGGWLNFDAIWLMGVNDQAWPPAASPNPFIPVSVQRASNMPHASAERELAFTQALFKAYLGSTEQLIASYALHAEDQSLSASHLLAGFTAQDPDQWIRDEYHHPYYQSIYQSRDLEQEFDIQAPALVNNGELLRGGTQILKNQAACPFKAFALHRMQARELEQPSHHVTPQQRGIMLHRALELLWLKVHKLEVLMAASASELQQWIRQAVTNAVCSESKRRPDLFSESLIQLEIGRQEALIAQWMLLEQQREAFQVLKTESAVTIDIADVPISVRIDRLDRLADGSLVLIDYKTGICNTRQWQGDRLDEPQLPLYCISLNRDQLGGDISALAFAQIRADKLGFIGITQGQDIAPGIHSPEQTRYWEMPLDWDEIKVQWRITLEQLMRDFTGGIANVDPKNPSACSYCHLPALCRINDPRSFDEPSL